MILVRTGQHDRQQSISLALDEGGVGHQHIDPRHGVTGEGDAKIHHDPAALAGIKIEVHADLTRAAERHEMQSLGLDLRRCRHDGRPVLRR